MLAQPEQLRTSRMQATIAAMPASDLSWTSCTAALPALADGEVQVWWGDLGGAPWWEPLFDVLSAEEHQRAARLRFAADRLRTLSARALARVLLAANGAGPARDLVFASGPHGKPYLAKGPSDLHFNLAHSGRVVLVAVARTREVGVDVEQIRSGIADRAADFCSPAEAAALAKLDPARREAGFFACWTRKEAYLKARGDGLAVALDRFDVEVDPDLPPVLLATRHDLPDVTRWTMAQLPPIPSYAAAVAATGGGWRPRCWRIQDFSASNAWLAAVE